MEKQQPIEQPKKQPVIDCDDANELVTIVKDQFFETANTSFEEIDETTKKLKGSIISHVLDPREDLPTIFVGAILRSSEDYQRLLLARTENQSAETRRIVTIYELEFTEEEIVIGSIFSKVKKGELIMVEPGEEVEETSNIILPGDLFASEAEDELNAEISYTEVHYSRPIYKSDVLRLGRQITQAVKRKQALEGSGLKSSEDQ